MKSIVALLVFAALMGHVYAQAPTVMREQRPNRAHSRPCRRCRHRTASPARNRHAERRKSVRSTHVKTDSNGNYEFASLPAGPVFVFASRAGYLEQNFDQPSPFARYRLLELADGEQLDGVDFRLHRGAVITGVITDDAGEPLPDVSGAGDARAIRP